MAKPNKVLTILGHRCPRCAEGRLFKTGTFSFSKPFEMHQNCEVCGQNYFPEPGFYYGAMFISYLIVSFFSLAVAGSAIIFLDWSLEASFGLLIVLLLLLYVWFFRTSRSIWIGANVKFDPDATRNNP